MPPKPSRIWHPEKAISQIPERGIGKTRLYLRSGPFANQTPYLETVRDHLKESSVPEKLGSNFCFDLKASARIQQEIFLAIIEATVTIRHTTCVDALRNGLEMTTAQNDLRNRVIPIVVIDQDRAHTLYEGSSLTNPDGPQQARAFTELWGGLPLMVTPNTIQEKLSALLNKILQGQSH